MISAMLKIHFDRKTIKIKSESVAERSPTLRCLPCARKIHVQRATKLTVHYSSLHTHGQRERDVTAGTCTRRLRPSRLLLVTLVFKSKAGSPSSSKRSVRVLQKNIGLRAKEANIFACRVMSDDEARWRVWPVSGFRCWAAWWVPFPIFICLMSWAAWWETSRVITATFMKLSSFWCPNPLATGTDF